MNRLQLISGRSAYTRWGYPCRPERLERAVQVGELSAPLHELWEAKGTRPLYPVEEVKRWLRQQAKDPGKLEKR